MNLDSQGFVDAGYFGVAANGSADDAPALQKAIDHVLSTPTCRGVQLLPGIMRLGSPLKIWPASSVSQPSIVLRGMAHPAGFADGSWQSVLRPDFGDRPTLYLQRARGVVIEGIVFDGALKRGWSPDYAETLDPRSFAVSGVRDSQFSPQCAICFDPSGNGAQPADGGYPGIDYIQKLNGSAKSVIRGCVLRNYIVGVLCDPNGVNSNTDTLSFERNYFLACKTAYASGGTQVKAVNFYGNHFERINTIFDGATYGPGKGRPPKLVSGGSFVICGRIANYATEGGGTRFDGVDGESIGALGTFGSTYSGVPDVSSFSGCDFTFNAATGVMMPPWLYARQRLAFRDSTFWVDRPLAADNSWVTWSGMQWNSYGVPGLPPEPTWADKTKVAA